VPARELYGADAARARQGQGRARAFEATLKKEPHRLGATLGAAKAAQQLGDAAAARQYYAAAVALGENAEPSGPRLRQRARS
jgi:uncharacterized protein HemY